MVDDVDGDGPCVCGGVIARDRRDGFCSSWCRTRDAQGLPAQAPPPRFTSSSATVLAPVDRAPEVDAPVAEPAEDEPKRPRYRQRRRLIADEVEDRLRQVGMLDTWQGGAALDIADALDWSGGSGSARAALHRELRSIMGDLLRGVDEPGSKVGGYRDELEARRERRRAAGGA